MESIKNGVLTSVLTALILGSFSYMFYEIETYKELRKTLPQVKELVEVRIELETEYKRFRNQTNLKIDSLVQENKRINRQIEYNSYYIRLWNGQ